MKAITKQVLALLLALLLLGGACLAASNEEIYERGKAQMEAGDYLSAAEYFEALGDYLDSAALAKQARERRSAAAATPQPTAAPQRSKYTDYGIDQLVSFGRYEQDGNTKNGAEPVEWVVLKSDGARKLLMSRYVLDALPFNNRSGKTTWAESSIRGWLNDYFYRQAFSAAEQKCVELTNVAAHENHWYPQYSAGTGSQDHVFLLSVPEFEAWVLHFDGTQNYKTKDQVRAMIPERGWNRCEATAYARKQGAYVSSKNGFCRWWLRSPGDGKNKIANVFASGHYIADHMKTTDGSVGVRPVIWVDFGLYQG